jgi:predicted Zn-dependent protease
MKKELYSILKESKASDFIIKEITTYSQEAFFIGQKLDMSRAKEVTHTMVTVYVDSDDKKYRGSATKEIHPTYSVEEIKKEIDKAIFAARFVQNPWFPLVADQQSEGNDLDVNLTEELVKICEAMQKVKAKENEKVNSYEVFVNKKKTHILNSQGVDVTFYGFDCEVEAVIKLAKQVMKSSFIKICALRIKRVKRSLWKSKRCSLVVKPV